MVSLVQLGECQLTWGLWSPVARRVRPLTTNDARELRRSHAPDYFACRADGSAVVLDCRPADRRKPADVAKFDATAAACASLGWEHRLAGAADPIRTANLRWLAGYRHPRYRIEATGTDP